MTIKKLLLLLLIVPLVFAIQSCGKGAGTGYTPPGKGPGDPVYIKLKPSRYAAQTNGCIEFYAEVHDAQGELLANIPVTFTNLSEPFGQVLDRCGGTEIDPPVVINTDSWGRARVTLYSTTPGFATMLAQTYTGAQPRDRKTVLFSFCSTYECLVLAPSLELDVDSEPPDGIWNEAQDFIIFDPLDLPDDKANLYATVRDQYGALIPYNAHVVWGSDHTEASFIRTESYTNEDGLATALVEFIPGSLRAGETHVNVWAYSDNVSSFVVPFDIVTFFLQPVFITNLTVTADPSVVSPENTSDVTATLMLNTGDPAPDGVLVTFTSCLCEDPPDCTICTDPCGLIDPIVPVEGGEGQAANTFTAPATLGTCMVTATSNSVSGSTLILVTDELTVLPDSVDVNGTVGGTATFNIFGGVSPYIVISDSSNAALDPVLSPTGDSFTVTVPAGTESDTVTYTVRDSIGDEVNATVRITTDALAVFPSTVTIDAIAGGVATYTIYGGVPPYDIFTSDPLYPPVPTPVLNSGDSFTATVVGPVTPLTVTYTIRDSVGTTATATLSITGVSTPLTVTPTAGTFSCTTGGTLTFFPSGGVQPYASTSLDPTSTITTDDTLLPTSFNVNLPAASCLSFPAASTVVNVVLTDSNTPASTVTVPITVTNP